MVHIALAPLMLFSWILRCLPLTWLAALGFGLGKLLQGIGFRKKIVEGNLQLALGSEKSPDELRVLKSQIYIHIGTLFLEIARNFTLTTKHFVDEVEVSDDDRVILDKMKAEGRGLLVISAHIGNWEIFPAAVAARGYPVSIVAKKMSNPLAQTLIEQRRQTTGFEIIYAGNTLQKMAEALKEGRFVGCMLDQHMPGSRGLRVNFFGVPAASIRGIAKLAKESKCTILPIFVYRLPNGKHRLKILEPVHYIEVKELPEESPERLLREEWLNTQQYQDCMEKIIRHNLNQWLWIHRRWKTNRTPLNHSTAHHEQNI